MIKRCGAGHEWTVYPSELARGILVDCPYCAGKRIIKGFNDFATTHPQLSQEIVEGDPTTFTYGSTKKIKWRCSKGHEYIATPNARTNNKSTCGYCSGHKVMLGFNDLATTHPHLISKWHDSRDITTISAGSRYNATWVCLQGHTTKCVVSKMVRRNSCAICSGRKVVKGVNDVFTLNKVLSQEWSCKNLKGADCYTVGSDQKVWWKCFKCQHEWQAIIRNRAKTKCPRCTASKHVSSGEKELQEYVKSIYGSAVFNTRNVIAPYELDIYIPDLGLAIEYDGVFWHSERHDLDKRSYKKWEMCRDKEIQLISIWETDWENKQPVVKKLIDSKLTGAKDVVGARKTNVLDIDYSTASMFLDTHHIQGSARGTWYRGLFYKDQLIAVAVYTRRPTGVELVRYASVQSVIGGMNKLTSTINSSVIYSFADRRLSNGSLYLKSGWTQSGSIKPDYKYLYNGNLEHKFNFRKKRFKNDPKLKYIDGLTEKELAALNKLYRVYDNGKERYLWAR